jgi:PleD family two-component response regulator
VTASFGIASLSPGTSSPAQLVAEADAALYAAKQVGRNRVRHYLDLPAERDSF